MKQKVGGKRGLPRKKTHEEYVKELEDLGTGVVVNEEYINYTTGINHTCPECKRDDWKVKPRDMLNERYTKCADCVRTYWTDEKYKNKLKEFGIEVNEAFISTNTKIRHTCPLCKQAWFIKPNDIIHIGVRMCKECSNNRDESVMATTLKQVLKHEYNAIYEYDAGFRGPNGGISCYDIYVEKKNTLVECQSRYHDDKEQVIIDKLKEEYAIKHGYRFIKLDSRENTPLQAIQIFFPEINSVPEYVDLSIGNKKIIDYDKAQELLNKGKSYKEISKEMGIHNKTLAGYVHKGKLNKKVGITKWK